MSGDEQTNREVKCLSCGADVIEGAFCRRCGERMVAGPIEDRTDDGANDNEINDDQNYGIVGSVVPSGESADATALVPEPESADLVAPQESERRGVSRWVVAAVAGVAVLIGVGATAAIMSVGEGEEDSIAMESADTILASSQTSAPAVGSTSVSTSTGPSTPATSDVVAPEPTPEAVLATASSLWAEHVAALGGAVVFSEVALVNGEPRAATFSAQIDSPSRPANTWLFDGAWRPEHELITDGGFDNVTDIVADDFTGDGSAEILVQFTPNRSAGALFRFEDDAWILYEVADALQADAGQLFGFENTCDPDCAAGNTIRYELVWNGTAFEYQFEQPEQPPAPPPAATCPSYVYQQYAPLSLCTKGESVQQLQDALIFYGYLQSPADGFFGPATDSAFRAFQVDYGVAADGIAQGGPYFDLIETYNRSR